jgi:hypothetical protein
MMPVGGEERAWVGMVIILSKMLLRSQCIHVYSSRELTSQNWLFVYFSKS